MGVPKCRGAGGGGEQAPSASAHPHPQCRCLCQPASHLSGLSLNLRCAYLENRRASRPKNYLHCGHMWLSMQPEARGTKEPRVSLHGAPPPIQLPLMGHTCLGTPATPAWMRHISASVCKLKWPSPDWESGAPDHWQTRTSVILNMTVEKKARRAGAGEVAQ